MAAVFSVWILQYFVKPVLEQFMFCDVIMYDALF